LEATLHVSSAYLLVSHGSRDPRPQIALEHLAKLVKQRLQARRQQSGYVLAGELAGEYDRHDESTLRPEPLSDNWRRFQSSQQLLVGTAVLELAPLPLHQQIQHFAEQALAAGYELVKILPLFLLPGVHVMDDLPAEVAIAQQQLGNRIALKLCPYLGSQTDLGQLLLNSVDLATAPSQLGKVLLAHGSRRPDSQHSVEAIAAQLGAIPAYWSVEPALETQVTELIKRGHQQIAILPYFLFEGGITDAIGERVDQLTQQFPYTRFHLFRPIGATAELADRAVKLLV
jgi:sirohydrochlorin ferrochelatase